MKKLTSLVLSFVSILAAPLWAQSTSGLIGHWKLDEEGRGELVADASPNQWHGMRSVGKTEGCVSGKLNGAFHFPEAGTIRLDRHAAAMGKLTNFTLSMWIRYEGGASRQLFTFSDGTLSHRLQMEVHNDCLHFGWQNGGSFAGFRTGELAWVPGAWYHVVFVNDARSGKSILRSNDLVQESDANTLGPAGLSAPVKRVEIGSLNGGYHLYEIGLDGKRFRQITSGGYSDIDPIYLPGGRHLFLSTRAEVYAQCGMWARSHILTRCDADGSNIHILSPATEPEYSPSLLDDGRILFTRWEYVDKFANRIQALWTMRPDGTAMSTFWGNQTVSPDHLGEARQIPGSGKVVFTGFGHHDVWAGCIGIVDPRLGLNFPQGIWKVTQERPWPDVGDNARVPTPGATPQYHTSGKYAAYKTPYPLSEELFLVSARTGGMGNGFQYSAGDRELGRFKLYLMDLYGNRELLYEGDHNVLYAQPVRPRRTPPQLPDLGDMPGSEKNADKVREGVFFSANIFEGAPAEVRQCGRYLRVVESMPKNYSIGIVGSGGKPFGNGNSDVLRPSKDANHALDNRLVPGREHTPDGQYDTYLRGTHNGPTLWVARIYAPTARQYCDYFDKVNAYYRNIVEQLAADRSAVVVPYKDILYTGHPDYVPRASSDKYRFFEQFIQSLEGARLFVFGQNGGGTVAELFAHYKDRAYLFAEVDGHADPYHHYLKDGAYSVADVHHRLAPDRGALIQALWGCHSGDFTCIKNGQVNLTFAYILSPGITQAAYGCSWTSGTEEAEQEILKHMAQGDYLGAAFQKMQRRLYSKAYMEKFFANEAKHLNHFLPADGTNTEKMEVLMTKLLRGYNLVGNPFVKIAYSNSPAPGSKR